MSLIRDVNLLRLTCCFMLVLGGSQVALAAEGQEGYYPGDLGQAIAVIVTFIILLLILRKWAWKPIVTQLRHREMDMTDALNSARQQEQQAGELLKHYKIRLDRAESDAQKLLANTRQEAELMRQDTIQSARGEARKSAEAAREELQRQKQQALVELRSATAEMASDIAGKVVRKELSGEDQKRLLAYSLEEIKKQAVED